eukprot:Skav212866  [mRNA]  locus=scaffold151:16248:26844:+ [translate_table: standard]
MEVSFSAVKVRSTTETSGVGTRKAMPVNLPLVVGSTSPTAFAAPVALGMMLQDAARPPRQSWQRRHPRSSEWRCRSGWWSSGPSRFQRPPVVQEALDTTLWLALSYSVWFTPQTKVFKSPFPGAEMMTFLAPSKARPWGPHGWLGCT